MANEDYGYDNYSPDVFASTPYKEEKQKKSWLDTLGGVVDVIGKGIDSYIKIKPEQTTTPAQSPIFVQQPPKKSGSGGLIIASVVGVAAIVGLVIFLKNKNKS